MGFLYADPMIVIALVGVFISGFLLGAVFRYRRLEDWFDPWLPAAVTDRFDDSETVTGDVPPDWIFDDSMNHPYRKPSSDRKG